MNADAFSTRSSTRSVSIEFTRKYSIEDDRVWRGCREGIEVLRRHPGEAPVDVGDRIAFDSRTEELNPNRLLRIRMGDVSHPEAYSARHPEFLGNLAFERSFRCFAGFDLATGEFPFERQMGAFFSLAKEVGSAPLHYRRDNLDGRVSRHCAG